MKTAIFIFFFALAMTGCYYDKEELLYPQPGNCDVTGVTYSGSITAILGNNGCNGCHSGSSPSGNISLQGYSNVKAVAANGKLYGAVSHSPGFAPMPLGGNKLSACDISKIKAWVDAGAPNN